jgi:hypothetical protein
MQPVLFSRCCLTAEPFRDDEEQISHAESGLSTDKYAKRDCEDQTGSHCLTITLCGDSTWRRSTPGAGAENAEQLLFAAKA